VPRALREGEGGQRYVKGGFRFCARAALRVRIAMALLPTAFDHGLLVGVNSILYCGKRP